MRIAQIAPLTEAIPPKLYGGTERVISWLADELVALGHDVVLFASGDSQTSANLEACWPKALRLDGSVRDPNALHIAMLERVRQRAHDFDLLHFHLDYYPFSLFSRQPTPFVTTLHGRLDLPEHQVVFATFPSIPVISISDAQRRPVAGAGWIRTIHHGLPERLLTPQPVAPAYLSFLGRISPEKAVDQSIWIAKRCGVPLKIAAKVDAVDRDYFESEIVAINGVDFGCDLQWHPTALGYPDRLINSLFRRNAAEKGKVGRRYGLWRQKPFRQAVVNGADPAGASNGPPLGVRNRDHWDRGKGREDHLVLRQVESAMERGDEWCRLTGKQGERIVIEMKVQQIEIRSPLADSLEHGHMQRIRVADRAL